VWRGGEGGLRAGGGGARAAHAGPLPAAVVVGDDVALPGAGVAAGADPGDRRHLGPRRALALRPATARTEEAVDRAVTPVGALSGIADVRCQPRVARGRQTRVAFRRTRDRQERKGGGPDHGGAEPR